MSAPAVAVASDGKSLVAAWKDLRAGAARVWWSRTEAPAPFEKDEPVVDEVRGDQDHPSLALDDRGRAWIAWEDGRKREARVRLRSLTAGGAPRDLADASQGTPAFPVLAAGKGFLVVAWEAGGEGKESVFAARVATGD